MEQASFRADVAVAFEVLAEGLAPFIDERMAAQYPDDEWVLLAATKLGKRPDVLVSLSDPHFQLEVLNRWWGPAFSEDLSEDVRATIAELRTARNHWAHPDEDHPFDQAYAIKVHNDVDEVLRAIGSPLTSRITDLLADLRWRTAREQARREGRSERDVLLIQMLELQQKYDQLQDQLEQAKDVARSATGRTRAVSRQLAELQSQYAAVAQLRDEYDKLQAQLVREHDVGSEPPTVDETESMRHQLASAEMAMVNLRREASSLREQLAETRQNIRYIDPVETEVGRRWIWLMTVLLLVLGVLVVAAYYTPR